MRIASGTPILPMSWKSPAKRSVSRLCRGRPSSRPISTAIRCTRSEWPAVYGSFASTVSLRLATASRALRSSRRFDSTRLLDPLADEEGERGPEGEEDDADREPDHLAARADQAVERRRIRVDLVRADHLSRPRAGDRRVDLEQARDAALRTDAEFRVVLRAAVRGRDEVRRRHVVVQRVFELAFEREACARSAAGRGSSTRAGRSAATPSRRRCLPVL